MGKYIKSHSNFILQKKHQKVDEGTVFYQDQLTVNGISEFSNVDGQIPIYRDGNFLLTTRLTNGYTRSMSPRKYLNNSYSGDVWTNQVLDNYPEDKDSQIDTIQIKFSYYSLRQFSYYGSCAELVRASINDILRTYPAEMYVNSINGVGSTVTYIPEVANAQETIIGTDGFVNYIDNPFDIDIITKRAYSELEDSDVSIFRYFSNEGYLNYEVVDTDGKSHDVTGWEVMNRYNLDGTPFTGTDDEWTQAILKGLAKTCFKNGDELARITIYAEDGIEMNIRAYKRVGSITVLNTTDEFVGYHVKLHDDIIDDWFLNLDRFEAMLLQRDTTPMYTCKLEVLTKEEPSEEIFSSLQKFTFPVGKGDWNLDIQGNAFISYVEKLRDMASNYDEFFCDNLYKNMTHESVKNMDWSYRRFYNAESTGLDDEYADSQKNMNKLLRLMGREFDEIKFYIDGLSQLNVLNYRDDETNMPDYFLSDSCELEGWEIKPIYTKTLNEYISYSGSTIYRDTNADQSEFLDSFNGIEFDVNEKENYAMLKCENRTVVKIDGEVYPVSDEKTITVNGKVYHQTEVSGIPCFDIVTDIPYTVRYIVVDGVRYDVNEDTKTVTIPVAGQMKTYTVEDGQTEVVVSKSVSYEVRVYDLLYDQNHIQADLADDKIVFSINRTGATHNNVPVSEGLEQEVISTPATEATTTGELQTTGWSSDNHVGDKREYIFDPYDGSKRIYLKYIDNNPVDDMAQTVFVPTVQKYATYTRVDGDCDKVHMTVGGVASNAYYATFPVTMEQGEYLHRYSTLNGFPSKLTVEGDDTSRLLGTTEPVSADFDAKKVTVKELSGEVLDGVSMRHLSYGYPIDGYSMVYEDGVAVYNDSGATPFPFNQLIIAEPTVEDSPESLAEYQIAGRDWSTLKTEFEDLKTGGVPKYSDVALNINKLAQTINISGDILFKQETGTPVANKTNLKGLVGKTIYVSLIIAHAYKSAKELTKFSSSVWCVTDDIYNEYGGSYTWSLKTAYESVVKRYPAFARRTNIQKDYMPLIAISIPVSFTLQASDVTADVYDIGNMEDVIAVTGASDYQKGFLKSKVTNTAFGVLYNLAVNELYSRIEENPSYLKDTVFSTYGVSLGTDNVTLTDPYLGTALTLTNDEADDLFGINHIGGANALDNWYGYGFTMKSCKIVPSKYSYAPTIQLGPVDPFNYNAYIDPYNQENNQGFFDFEPIAFPPYYVDKYYVLGRRSVTGSITIDTDIETRKSDKLHLYEYNNQKFTDYQLLYDADNFKSLIEHWTSDSLKQYDEIEDCGFICTNLNYQMNNSSMRRLNIPSYYTDELVGIKNPNNKFMRVFAEREVMTSIRTRYPYGTAVTEDDKIYNYFATGSTATTPDYMASSIDDIVRNPNAHNRFDVNDLGWFYFKTDASIITLSDLGYCVYESNSASTYDYTRPASIKPLVYNEDEKVYQAEDGTSLDRLPNGIYYLADEGAGLFNSDEFIAQTYKDFEFNYKETQTRQKGEDVTVDVNSEEKQKHISNYYFPEVQCITIDDTKYPLHREFTDDSDYEFTPYDCTLDEYCGGYFYKKCCVKEQANGVPSKVERQPYVIYKNHKVYLCDCECSDNYYTVVVNGVEYSAYTSGNTIQIEDSVLNIQYEDIMYAKISNYSSSKDFASSDVNYRFLKNLRLNSRKLLQRKGTIEGLESMLGLFGLKSKRWYDNLSLMQQDSWGNYDYTIKEYTCVTDKIEDLYDRKFNMGKIAYYNKLKQFIHSNSDSETNRYDGLPVRYISYYKDKDGNITKDQYSPDMSVNTEFRKDLYPYFEKDKMYDGRTYYQMNGGWLPIYPFKFSKNDDVILPYMNDNQIMKGLHTETLRNIRSFQTLEELLDVARSSVKDDQIVEVQDLDTVYAIVNGRLYEVFTDSFIFADNDGVKREQYCSYIKLFVDKHSITVGDYTYRDTLYVSDPLSYCYDEDDTLQEFQRSYNLDDENDGKMVRVFLYKLDALYRKAPVNVNEDTLKDDENMYVSITLQDANYLNDFDIYQNDETKFSHYFKLANADYCDTLNEIGWFQLGLTDPDAIRIDSIVDNFKGNNPHSDVFGKYDNGFEYIARFAQLFRFPIENDSFDKSKFGYNGIKDYDDELENLGSIGFDNLVSVSGDISRYSVSGDEINTRDNYNMVEDQKAHFFGNFYTNNKGTQNAFIENSICKNKYGMCDEVEMTSDNTLYFGYDPTYEQSGSVYNLSNIPTLNLTSEMSQNDSYIRDNMGVSADTDDYHTERILNNKILDINFITDYEYYTKNYLEKYKYIDDVILFYLQQMIPSTTICRINFGGILRYLIKEGAVFEIGEDGSIYTKEPDCGSVQVDYKNDIRVESVTDLCPHDQPTTYYAVYFYSDGKLVKSETVSVGGSATAPAVSKEGYRLTGWTKDFSNVHRETITEAVWEAK